MKVRHRLASTHHASAAHRPNGFALVITLSLMVLLTVVAVGLLSLSAVELRSASLNNARSTARQNALLALQIAIGDLQKHAGPDQRITARSDVLDENIAKPRLTGVWESWNQIAEPPTTSSYEDSTRDRKFLRWLTSSPDMSAPDEIDFAKTANQTGTKSTVTLWGEGTLGDSPDQADLVIASKIATDPSEKNLAQGALAWAVMDEGVKARINTPWNDDVASDAEKFAQLGSGARPNTSSIPTLDKLERDLFKRGSESFETVEKGISRLNFELAAETLAQGTDEQLKALTHDVTTMSVGLFTDTARGGLKEDFNLLADAANLPTAYANKGIYKSLLGDAYDIPPSDPRWESLHEFSRIYKDGSTLSASNGVPVLKTKSPKGWNASITSGRPPRTRTVINKEPPAGVNLMPTIAKVQVLFSLIARDLYPGLPQRISGRLTQRQKSQNMHGPQDGHFRSTKFDYDLHLLYTPIVTLHNPYNVALEFTDLSVDFIHVPFAMKIYRNGQPQSRDFAPLETMYGDNRDGAQDKIFGMNLKTSLRGRPNPRGLTFRLLPGEVKMFSPYIDPNRTYQTDLRDRKFWDIYVGTGITTDIDAIPGWRGDGIGFDCDNLAGAYAIDGTAENGHWTACYGLAFDDKIHVEFIPRNIRRSDNKFSVTMSARVPGSPGQKIVSAIEVDYESPDGLENFMKANGASMPMRYPKADANPNYVRGIDMRDPASTPVSDIRNVKPFALLSLQGKTTNGARDAAPEDGRLATKPWAFAHANIGSSTQRVLSEHSANHSHEIDLQVLTNGTLDLLHIDGQDRSNFISGHTGDSGSKFGIQYDVPLSPLQSLSSLNGANPGGSSGYLPRFAQPIGNSWAHPLLKSDSFLTLASGQSYADHSFLLNTALYDRFYFSGIADRDGPFGSGRNASSIVDDFTAGKPLQDPRLTLYTPDGRPASELTDEIASDDGYARVAAWQVMNGPFNINSTSVSAWKAMLGSVHDAQAVINQINKSSNQTGLTELAPADDGSDTTRISRFRLPASESEEDGASSKDGYWLGPREYSDQDLQMLAENIVDQVRARGPFLSMAEFVNRRLGSDSAEESQRGALQQAIDETDLNSKLVNNASAGFEIPASAVANYKYRNSAAGAGPSYQGAPGFLTQADLLTVLGNAATPRSDTFTVRAYGEARDNAGKVTASATCEAVVQRVPEYLDPADPAETSPSNLTSDMNQTFGRRFQIASFRWLGPGEI